MARGPWRGRRDCRRGSILEVTGDNLSQMYEFSKKKKNRGDISFYSNCMSTCHGKLILCYFKTFYSSVVCASALVTAWLCVYGFLNHHIIAKSWTKDLTT